MPSFEDPRWGGLQPAGLHRGRDQSQGRTPCAEYVSVLRRGGQAVDDPAQRTPQPRHPGVLISSCDRLRGLPDSMTAIWPQTNVQLCIVRHDSQLAAVGLPGPPAGHHQRTATDPHRTDRRGGQGPFAEFEQEWGSQYPTAGGPITGRPRSTSLVGYEGARIDLGALRPNTTE